ncbi:MAG TPA: deoxyguanosinetriphosphate triphosphohydrolase [Caulobacteraceae bacterium]|nr:deoxyguanosinetriphosphate triphosphohydrolase [Caulobacteraceae bacterium]
MADAAAAPIASRAGFASDPAASPGRRHPEPPSRTRTPFARDRDRIIHAQAFRRLKEKTQVFVAHEGDHFRTRLTHSLEVAQIARSLAKALGLDDDLTEAVALAHDLGHPPFGHTGEEALDAATALFGGFDHNVQTFRVVTELERRYPDFDGLNLSWETLEGVLKHNGPIAERLGRPSWRAVARFNAEYDLKPATFASAEAQVAAIADDIAYNNHDVDDGLQAELFRLDELMAVPLVGPILAALRAERPDLDERMVRLEAVRRMIGAIVDDVLEQTARNVADGGVAASDDVRMLGRPIVAFSTEMAEDLGRLRLFLHQRMYRHFRVNRTRSQARRILTELFELFVSEPEVLPTEWFERARERDEAGRARVVCDYIAGMTDRYAIEEHRKLFNLDVWG